MRKFYRRCSGLHGCGIMQTCICWLDAFLQRVIPPWNRSFPAKCQTKSLQIQQLLKNKWYLRIKKSVDNGILDHFNYATLACKDPINDGKDWSFSFLDCIADLPTCLIACCFPCVAYAQNRQTLKGVGQTDFSSDAIWFYCSSCVGCVTCLAANQRHEIRKKAGIKGNYFADLCIHSMCSTCALVQEKRELAKLG